MLNHAQPPHLRGQIHLISNIMGYPNNSGTWRERSPWVDPRDEVFPKSDFEFWSGNDEAAGFATDGAPVGGSGRTLASVGGVVSTKFLTDIHQCYEGATETDATFTLLCC